MEDIDKLIEEYQESLGLSLIHIYVFKQAASNGNVSWSYIDVYKRQVR